MNRPVCFSVCPFFPLNRASSDERVQSGLQSGVFRFVRIFGGLPLIQRGVAIAPIEDGRFLFENERVAIEFRSVVFA